MSQSRVTVQSDLIVPPRAGQITCLAVSGVAASLDLRLLGPQTANMAIANSERIGLQGAFCTIVCDVDLYVNFGTTQASVTGANAPVVATTGINAASGAFWIPEGTAFPLYCEAGVDVFMGYIGGATAGTMRVYISSPPV